MSDFSPESYKSEHTKQEEPSIVFTELTNVQSEAFSRVSPLAIIYFFAKSLYQIISGFLIYSLPAIAAAYSSLKSNLHLVVIGIALFLLLILVGAIVKYWFYFYKFSDERVEIKQGVFKKSHLDLPFKKIQNVKIVQPFYYRFNQYSFIELDTAGSSSQEAKIVALPLSLAENFKQLILQIKDTGNNEHFEKTSDSVSRSNEQESEQILNKRTTTDLIIHGISNNRVWIFLGFLAPFFNVIGENVNLVLETVGIDLISYLDYESQSVGLFILHVLSIVLFIMGVLVLFSVIGSIFVFHGYQLSRLGDRYIRKSGLLTKHEVSMRLSRIQIAVQQQDWLDMLIKRTNLRFEQNTSVPVGANQAGNINNASKLIVPSVTIEESAELIKNALNVINFSEIEFLKISRRYIVRVFLVRWLPLLVILYTIPIVNSVSNMNVYIGLTLLTILILALVGLRWYRWGYFFTNEYVYIRKGLFGINYSVFPRAKTQQVIFKQSVFMKRVSLADVKFVLASGSYTVPLISEKEAVKQVDNSLKYIAFYKPAWM